MTRPNRRGFLRTVGGLTLLTTARPSASTVAECLTQAGEAVTSDRAFWLSVVRRLAYPVLSHLANGTLKARMPVEQAPRSDRRSVTHLEAIGRLLAGIAPWLELHHGEPAGAAQTAGSADASEQALAAQYADLARQAIARASDPASPDYMNFTRERQPLVDAAFLAQGLLRAPRALVNSLDAIARTHLVAALESTRAIVPGFNNWLLFSAAVEAGLKRLDAAWDRVRVEYALRQHDQWYKGDGTYGDGPTLNWDYYNSFVIHPMMLDVLDECQDEMQDWKAFAVRELERARRYAAIQERLIAPDGSFPAIGRSLAYRFGAFHLLAQIALRRALPDGTAPAQVRAALTAVIRRSIEAPGTFDGDGWLRIGFCGHQPGIGETYISTGSLYLCAAGLLPLGLPASDEFWSAPPQPWTSARAWSGQPFPIDHAL
jgi:hypothetical protein